MTFFKVSGLVILSFVLSSCTWVKLTREGESVGIWTAAEVANCTRTGTTTVEVLDKAVIDRNPEKVALELRTLARNRAADRGNVIVPEGPPANGEQTFIIYRCN
jgi:hypothetical protein